MGCSLKNHKPVYYKTETIALISNYLFSAWGKQIGERFTLKEIAVPLVTRGGLKEENGTNQTPLRKEEELLNSTVLEKILIND